MATETLTMAHMRALAWIVLGQECIVCKEVWEWMKEIGVVSDSGPNRQLAWELLSGINKNGEPATSGTGSPEREATNDATKVC